MIEISDIMGSINTQLDTAEEGISKLDYIADMIE